MSDINTITLTGRLGRDFELRFTPQGTAVATSALATDTGFGEKKKTHWLRLVIWGKAGEIAAEHLGKGSRIAVSGRLEVDTYQKDDGTEKITPEVHSTAWTFAGESKKPESPPQAQEAAPTTTRNVHEQHGTGAPVVAGSPQGDDIPF